VGIVQKAKHAIATLGESNRSRFVASLTAEKVAEVVETPAASAIVFAHGHEVGKVTKAHTKIQYLSKAIIYIIHIAN
jgi:CopG family nickel-responsive transcriptional regulator